VEVIVVFDLMERNFVGIGMPDFDFNFDYCQLRVLGGFLCLFATCYLPCVGCYNFASDIWVMEKYKVQSS
jgi:hypothetical protein